MLTIITALHCDSEDKLAWFGECAESVLGQEFQDWEWVIVDDASPHRPEKPGDGRVRMVRASKRQGPAMCRNTAAALASNDALLPLDGDDRLAAGALRRFADAWDPRLFVYADIQLLENGVPGRIITFPPYSFERSLEFKGNVPVTALHSKAAWLAAGGWKARFDAGLEDLEYWISVGAAGFCGRHIAGVSILYRRHPESRSQRMKRALRQQDMERKIKEFHSEIYQGRYPMGCCGEGRNAQPSASGAARPTALADENVLAGGTVWARYNGRRTGKFQVKGRASGQFYEIESGGHEFEIWAVDAPTFQRLGRGKDFTVGIPAPQPEEKPPEPSVQEKRYEPGKPEMAEIVRLDEPGHAAQESEPPPLAESEPIRIVQEDLPTPLAAMSFEKVRGGERVRAMLENESWTVEALAGADPEDLVGYPGVGKVAAAKIIAEANRCSGSD